MQKIHFRDYRSLSFPRRNYPADLNSMPEVDVEAFAYPESIRRRRIFPSKLGGVTRTPKTRGGGGMCFLSGA